MGNTTSMKEAEGSEGNSGAYHTRRRGRRHRRSGYRRSKSMPMQTKKVHFRRGRKSRRQRGGHAPAPLSPMALA